MYSHFKAARTNWTAFHQTYLVLHLLPDCVSFLCAGLSNCTALSLLSAVCCFILDSFSNIPGAWSFRKVQYISLTRNLLILRLITILGGVRF